MISGYVKYGEIEIPISLVEKLAREAADDAQSEAAARIKAEGEYLDSIMQYEPKQRLSPNAKQNNEDIPLLENPLVWYKGRTLFLYNVLEIETFSEAFQTSIVDEHHRERTVYLVKALLKKGELRKLKKVNPAFRKEIDRLIVKFSNFTETLEYVADCCKLAVRTDGLIKMTPILLSGPPGTGKSMLADELTRFFDSGHLIIRLEGAQTGSDLGGSSSFWSNSQPGKLFTLLTQTGEFANPVVILDEIDKTTATRYDPLGPLYSLLEPGTACKFQDLCYPISLDASQVMYIATCNDSEKIPAPLRSRFREFEINITQEQSRDIAMQIVGDQLLQMIDIDVAFSDDAIDSLSKLPPRRIKQSVIEGIGRALSRGRDVVTAGDFGAGKSKSKMGFL